MTLIGNMLPNNRGIVPGVVYVSLFAFIVLLISAPLADLSRIHLGPPDRHLNDQVGYITVARNLKETGRLYSNIIYPSTLFQVTTKNYLYLPGYYFALAASYAFFGFGLLQSYLPNLLAYLFSAVGLYLIGSKLYSTQTGYAAAALFILFPVHILYSFSAMSEMTLSFSVILASSIFFFLPDRWRPYLGALALTIPLLFREIGVFLIIPFGLLIYQFQKRNLRTTLVFTVLSLVISGVLLSSNVSSGRPSLLLANIFDDRFETVYRDALALSSISPQLGDWIPAISRKMLTNLEFLIYPVKALDFSFDLILFYTILLMMVILLGAGLRTRDIFLLSAGLFTLSVFIAILSFYAIFSYRGLRVILFTLPIGFLGSAHLFQNYIARRYFMGEKSLFRFIPAALIIGLAVTSLIATGLMASRFNSMDHIDDKNLAFMEQIGHDDRTLLVSPYEFSLYYVYTHYPVKYSFVPKNRETFALLAQRFEIGTLIISQKEYEDFFSRTNFEQYGLTLQQTAFYNGEVYLVWRGKPDIQARLFRQSSLAIP